MSSGTHPKYASACAVAARCCSGIAAQNAAISAFSEHPAAVILVSMGDPLEMWMFCFPSVTCTCLFHSNGRFATSCICSKPRRCQCLSELATLPFTQELHDGPLCSINQSQFGNPGTVGSLNTVAVGLHFWGPLRPLCAPADVTHAY